MFVRLIYLSFLPDFKEEAIRIFDQQIKPEIRRQKGIESVMMLHPTNSSDDFISLTIWDSIIDAHEYETSGRYQDLIQKLSYTFATHPVLKSFKVK